MRATFAIVVLALTSKAVADDKLAAEFLRRHPDTLKDFGPVTEALKADGLKGKELKREAARIKAGLGEHSIAPGEKAKAARHHSQRRGLPAGGTSVDQQRLARAMRARQKKAAVLAYYGQLNAWNAAATNANIGWGLRFVPRY